MHDVAEGVRHSVGGSLLNRRRRRGCGGGPIADAGRERVLRFVRRRRLPRTPLSRATGFAEAFALLAGPCREGFPGGFLAESIFGVNGRAASVDT